MKNISLIGFLLQKKSKFKTINLELCEHLYSFCYSAHLA